MLEYVADYPETDVIDHNRSFFDKHVYMELKSFIYGGELSPEKKDEWPETPSFEAVVEKINSYRLRRDIRIRIISETLGQLISEREELNEKPSFLLSYLSRETVHSAMLRKFNAVLGCECTDLLTLSHKIGDNIAEANKVFGDLRICDFSVHSGTFLYWMLNELIAVKSQLGLLVDKDGNPLYKYKFVAGNEGLYVVDKKDFKTVPLDGGTTESCYVQMALFHEKVALVRNCLFGVDAKPEMVLTCKLRLWLDVISCLDGVTNEALPLVESNIICGDALVSRFALKDDLLVALKHINQTVADYKRLAEKIKMTQAASDRQYLKELMMLIKNRLIEGIGWYSKDTDELLRLRREMSNLMTPGLFPPNEREQQLQQERLLLLQAKIKKQEYQLSTFRVHPTFEKAVEWRYVFPEMLDDRGEFVGFDAIIGIPPDAILAGIGNDKANFYKQMNYKVFKNTGNVSDMFCELANRLLVYGGCMAFITYSKWRRDALNYKIGEYLTAEMNPLQLLLFEEISPAFDGLNNKCAIIAQKDINRHRTVLCRVDAMYRPRVAELGDYVRRFATPVYRLVETGDIAVKETVSTVIAANVEYRSIDSKIKRNGLCIKNWDVRVCSGIMTGCDSAFIVDRQAREELIHTDYKNSDIIKPLQTGDFVKRYGDGIPEQWLLNIPWHFPLQYDKTIKAASTRAEERFQKQYSAVYAHLLKYKKELSSRNEMEVGLGFEWYALQHSGMDNSLDSFSEQKIVWKRDSSKYCFGIDYGGCAVLDDACFIAGQHLKFLLGVLNSTMGRYMLTDMAGKLTNESVAGIPVVESIAIPMPSLKIESDVISLVNRRISENNKSDEVKALTDEKIDRMMYDLYDLTENEIAFIRAQVNS